MDDKPTLKEGMEEGGGPQEKKKSGKKKSAKYYDEDGGVELLSSDGTSFRIPAYQLQASSSVFRNMINSGSDSVTEVVDRSLETGAVITALFDILLGDRDISEPLISVFTAQAVIELAQKYDFAKCLSLIRYQLRASLLDKESDVWRLFMLGACMGDHDTCTEAIRKMGGHNWATADADDEEFGNGGPIGGDVFDIRTWGLDRCRALGIDYLWALSRATSTRTSTSKLTTEADVNLIADEFKRLMTLKGAPKPSWDAQGKRL